MTEKAAFLARSSVRQYVKSRKKNHPYLTVIHFREEGEAVGPGWLINRLSITSLKPHQMAQ